MRRTLASLQRAQSAAPVLSVRLLHAAFGQTNMSIKGKVGGSGSGGGGGSRSTGKAGTKAGIKNEHGEIFFPDADANDKAPKVRAPLFDRETYYPTVVPFTHVDHPHDPNVATDGGLPLDLSAQARSEMARSQPAEPSQRPPTSHVYIYICWTCVRNLVLSHQVWSSAIGDCSARAPCFRRRGSARVPLYAMVFSRRGVVSSLLYFIRVRWGPGVQEPEEAEAAEMLGLTAATPDGVVALLQLPPLMPSVALFEAAERAALETPTSESQPLPDGIKPKPKFHKGPDLLKALPSGRVRNPCSHRLSAADWLMPVAPEIYLFSIQQWSRHMHGERTQEAREWRHGRRTELVLGFPVCVIAVAVRVAVSFITDVMSVVRLQICFQGACMRSAPPCGNPWTRAVDRVCSLALGAVQRSECTRCERWATHTA